MIKQIFQENTIHTFSFHRYILLYFVVIHRYILKYLKQTNYFDLMFFLVNFIYLKKKYLFI